MQLTENQTKDQSNVAAWLKEIEQALKREKDFRSEGKRILSIYEAEKKEQYQFNILYSNTETLAPALFNSCPRPVVKRRFDDKDPLGLMACRASERVLSFLQDPNNPEHPEFESLLQSAVHQALLPGRGLCRFVYDAEISSQETEGESEPQETVESETVCGYPVSWDRFLHGYAKTWESVPWIAYEHQMDKAELKANFGPDIAAQVKMTKMTEDSGDNTSGWGSRAKETEGIELCCVYEIWDKASREVVFITSGYPDAPLKRVPDPLGLQGFFNCPEPLTFFSKVTSLTPTALYAMYEEQAKELNAVTVRINKIVRALKVRGFYDGTIEGLDKLMQSDDNTLLPAENVAAMMQGQTLDRAIWLMPLEKLVSVLQQLYLQRTQVKQTIYEITGIADIMRGASQASETLGAQEIKNQWGTLRLKRAQKAVARYARNCLRLMLEIAVKKLSPATLAEMTGLPYPSAEQKSQVQALSQQLAGTGQTLPPEMASILQQPSWEEILSLLQDNLHRQYRVDIETNSTVDLEATEDKKDINEFLNAVAQFMNGVAPVVQSGAMPFEAAKAILMAVVRKYRFGAEVEEQINSMQAPQPPKPEGEAAPDPVAQAASQTALQAEQLKQQTLQMEFEYKKAEHEFKMQELAAKSQVAVAAALHKMRQYQQAQTKSPGITPE